MTSYMTEIYFLGKYQTVKELNIGGIIVLDNVSGETEQIVEPMVVSKVTSRYIVMIDFIYDYFVVVYSCFQNY